MTVSAQAALAIDNARLYQQQKDFSETMQHSLLPRELPAVPGLEVGHVYESSARVDVGGDVYDFLTLEDGRLAIILGDVTGKGIQAAADMAMAKFSFRALARMHPEPGDFLSKANDVVVDEIAVGKFITMLYVARRSEGRAPSRARAPAIRLRGSSRARAQSCPSRRAGSRWESSPGRSTRPPWRRWRRDPPSSSTPTASSSRGGTASSTARSGSTTSSPGGATSARRSSQRRSSPIAGSFAGGELGDDCAIVCLRLANAG